MTGPSQDWTKIGRYLAGESPPEEAAEVRRWLDEHAQDAELVAALDHATGKMIPPTTIDVESALRKVKTRAHAAPRTAVWPMVGLAAAAALVLFLTDFVVDSRSESEPRPGARAAIHVTPVGARDSIVLSDGSRVVLGPDTRLVARDREVELTGEAYFTVVHDERRPFTVRAGESVIRDVGTAFSVHSDRSGPVRVVVSEGAVQLLSGADSVLLAVGDVGLVSEAGRVEAQRGAATDDDLAWMRGRLVFRNATIHEVAADLRRWYGVELRVTDSALLARHFTGSFVSEPARGVLDVIALALGAHVEMRGDTAHMRQLPTGTTR